METFHRNLKTAISKVMETMFFLIPDEESMDINTVYIGIKGKPAYLIKIDSDRNLAERMTEDLLGIESGEVNDDLIYKCLQETANIIAGRVLLTLDSQESRGLTLPVKSKRDVFGKYNIIDEREVCLSFEGRYLKIIVEVVEVEDRNL
jgi:CheY-specific phosphatase CheX